MLSCMEEEKTTDVKENLVNFAVKNIYGDLAQPATREIGNAVSSLIKFVALPFSFLGMTADQLKERYREFLTDTISKVPPEKMCNPSANIVAPLLDHVKFVFDEIGISELFSNLLANAMCEDTEMMVHPAFVEMLRQMSPYDAEFMKLYFEKTSCIESEDVKWKRGDYQFKLTLDSLIRLGIVNVITYTNSSMEAYALSSFGQLFRDMCLMQPSNMSNSEWAKSFGNRENSEKTQMSYTSDMFQCTDWFGVVKKSNKYENIMVRCAFEAAEYTPDMPVYIILRIYNMQSRAMVVDRAFIECQDKSILVAQLRRPFSIRKHAFADIRFDVTGERTFLKSLSKGAWYVIQVGTTVHEMRISQKTLRDMSSYIEVLFRR